MNVHNHGTEEGPGLACRETIVDGQLVGACMPCACRHPKHAHMNGGVCTTITVSGPATPKAYWGAAAELHIGRTLRYCDCSTYKQPGTGEQVQNSEISSEEVNQ